MIAYRHVFSGIGVSAVLLGAQPAIGDMAEYPIRLVVHAEKGERQLVAYNEGHAPITLRVDTNDPDDDDGTWPATIVVEPRTRLAVGTLDEDDTAVAYSYYPGRIDARPDPGGCYRLPFGSALSFTVTQAYGGPLTSHDNAQNRYAVDFAMPEGTLVVAARAGVVIDVTLKHHRHGLDRASFFKANRVTVAHEDGTLAQYAHLAPGTPLVQRGERVITGTPLGYSGNTGYSSAPHLHFVVSKPALVDGKIRPQSIPFLFCGRDGAAAFAAATGMLAGSHNPSAVHEAAPPRAAAAEELAVAAHPSAASSF